MAGYYLKELTVPIPEDDRRVVIRRGKAVEYEIDRALSPDKGDTRVKRRVIGQVDPLNPGRMFPNEMFFQLFPENEVPEEVRDEFLRGCEIRRMMKEIRADPNRIINGVVNETKNGASTGSALNYVMIRRLFDDMYYAIEELAGRYPNEVIAPYKVKQINEVLQELRAGVEDERIAPYLRTIEETEETTDKEGKVIRTGLTYSDALLMLKWYRALPR